MGERRGAGRIRTFLRGRITFNNRVSTMECLVRDLSPTGARLALEGSGTLPEHFELVIPQKSTTYRCHMRWLRDEEVGVVFLDAAPPRAESSLIAEPAASDLVQRIRRLEGENEALRRRLAALTPAILEDA